MSSKLHVIEKIVVLTLLLHILDIVFLTTHLSYLLQIQDQKKRNFLALMQNNFRQLHFQFAQRSHHPKELGSIYTRNGRISRPGSTQAKSQLLPLNWQS